MSKCVHVDFSLYMGKGIFYFFLFFVEHIREKSPRVGRRNEKNEMTERIKSHVAWLSKFKCLAVFLKEKGGKKTQRKKKTKNQGLFCVCLYPFLGILVSTCHLFPTTEHSFVCLFLFLFKHVNP